MGADKGGPAGSVIGSTTPSTETGSASSRATSRPSQITEEWKTTFEAVRMRKLDKAKERIQANPSHWKAQDDDGHSLLHWASLVGSHALVEDGLKHGVNPDIRCNNGQTPLMWALTIGHIPVVRLLLEAKADMSCHDSLGATALMIATQHTGHERYQLLMLLVHRGGQGALADRDVNGCTTMHWAAWKGDLTALKLLDGFSADLQVLDSGGMTPLHRAVMASQPRVVPFLLECNCDPNQQTKDGKTAFDLATPLDWKMKAVLNGEKVDLPPALPEEEEEAAISDGGEEEKKEEKGDFVETFLEDISASWLTPYYHDAVNSILDVVRTEQTNRPSRGVNEPLMGTAAAPSQVVWEYGDDGL